MTNKDKRHSKFIVRRQVVLSFGGCGYVMGGVCVYVPARLIVLC